MEEALGNLRLQYSALGFSETNLSEEKDPSCDLLIFNKKYVFTDTDGTEKVANISVKYIKKFVLAPPEICDEDKTLISMHSIDGFQCWARFSDIYTQVGIGLINAELVNQQIEKLIEAHKNCEYGTIHESPEFTYAFRGTDMVDEVPFYLDPSVIDDVGNCPKNTFVISGLAFPQNGGYLVPGQALTKSTLSQFALANPTNDARRVYFFRLSEIPHFDGRIAEEGFLYLVEASAGIDQSNRYLQNIEGEFFIAIVFPNVPLNNNDIVVFKKNSDGLKLLPHARVKANEIFFSRDLDTFKKMAGKKMAIIGLGAIGSKLGLDLLDCGIQQLYVLDNDRVDYENIFRSIYNEEDVGKEKTSAFIDIAERKSSAFKGRIIPLDPSIKDLLTKKRLDELNLDLLVICIGDVYQEYKVSRIVRSLGFEKTVFVFGQNDCTWAGVYFQNSVSLGCQQCLFFHQQDNRELTMPFVQKRAPSVGCGDPSYVGGVNDMSTISGIAGKLITNRLTEEGMNLPNYFIWQSSPDFTARKDTHLELFSLKKYRVEIHANCDCKNI
ncbi:MAG: ThiF family adenylyltransferase [Thermincolia bacterium]